MIKIINLTKVYGKQIVLKNVNLTFLDSGFVCILGPSGCGKSTLLNIIGGLSKDYSGKVIINNLHVSKMNERRLQSFRAQEISFVFQNHNLFKFDTVEQNVKFPLVMQNEYPQKFIDRQVSFNLNRVELANFNAKMPINLSGGEQQRVAVSRALINNPSIILCDEPTAALDSKTGENIFKILKEQAQTRLVVVATHNQALARKYGEQIIEFKSGKVIQSQMQMKNVNINRRIKKAKIHVPFAFFFRSAIKRLMYKKWRFMTCNLLTTLGFITLGLSLILSSSLNNSLSKEITNLVGENYIVAKKKVNNYHNDSPIYLNKIELETLADDFSELNLKVGLVYENNMNSLMKHDNKFMILSGVESILLASIGLDAVNRFIRLDDYADIYPRLHQALAKDEVVLSLSKSDLLLICQQLDILPRTIEKLGEYLAINKMQLKLSVKNLDWQYSDEQILAIKGVKEGETTSLWHTDSYWNEWMIEECMRFKNIDNELEPQPWSLSKKYYFETIMENFVEFSMENLYFDNIHIARDQEILYRYYATFKSSDILNVSDAKKILKHDSNLKECVYSSNSSYMILDESVGAGFVSDFLITASEAMIDDAIDQNQHLKLGVAINYPKEIVFGNITNLNTDNLKFSSDLSNLTQGDRPNKVDEVVISSHLARQLFKSEGQAIGKMLNTAMLISSKTTKDEVTRTYQKSQLKITGVKLENQNIIYQSPSWTIIYFNDYMHVNSFNNTIHAMAFSLKDDSLASESLNKLKKAFPNIKFTCPILDIKTNINTTLIYVQYVFSVFSSVAILIAIILISLVIYLYVLENKHDARILLSLGGRLNDVKKMFSAQVFIMVLFSTLTSIITLVTIALVFNSNQSSILPITFTLTLKPFLVIVVTGILIALLVVKISLPKNKMVKST